MKKIFSLCLLITLLMNFASCLEALPEETTETLSFVTTGTEARETEKSTATTLWEQTEEPAETTMQPPDTEPPVETTVSDPDVGVEYILNGKRFYYIYRQTFERGNDDTDEMVDGEFSLKTMRDYYPFNLIFPVPYASLRESGYKSGDKVKKYLQKHESDEDFRQLPYLYYYLKQSGISKEDFIRINQQTSWDMVVLTDWQIDVLFDETDVNVIKEKLKSYGAFYFGGRLYDLSEVLEFYEDSDMETLKKWADEGDFLAYLDKMEEYFTSNPIEQNKSMAQLVRAVKEAVR